MSRPFSHAATRLAAASAISFAVALEALAAQPLVVQGLECRGDDGTWRVDASRTTAHYSASTPRKRDVVFRGSLQVLAATPPIAVWRGDTTHLPRETLVLSAREEACRMAVPGIPMGTHQALLSIRPGEAATGCCTARAGYDARLAPVANLAAKPDDDWSRGLLDLLPALNACAAREGAKLKAVIAARAQGSTVRVRLRESDGKDVDCVVDVSGRGTPTIGPASADAIGAGPWWYPARDPAPIVACGRLERVQGARGAAAGYLQYEPC